MKRAALLAALALPFVQPAQAQTVITPDQAPDLATGTTVQQQGRVTTIDGGTLRGDNLFHSFSRFDLGANRTARWTTADPASVARVINRVTGGASSRIAGTIDTTAIPLADFYFINPAGIVFAPGASVDVGGAAHFSTAHELAFSNGEVLKATTATGSSFSMADPVRFGFLGNNAAIRIAGDPVDGPSGFSAGDLRLTAGSIRISDAVLDARRITLRAAGDGATTVPVGRWDGPIPTDGAVRVLSSTVSTFADDGVDIAGGLVRLDDDATITAFASQIPNAAAIAIRADQVQMPAGSLQTVGIVGSGLNAGDIAITARDMQVGTFSNILTTGQIDGGGGTIRIAADSLQIAGGTIGADGLSAPGRSVGDIVISAGDLRLSRFGSISTSLQSSGGAPTGTSGNIVIDAGSLTIDTTGLILAENQSETASGAGSITVRAGGLTIAVGRISTRTETAIAGGSIHIDVTGELALTGFGGIQALSEGKGNAGAITIKAGSIRMANALGQPSISTETLISRPQEIEDINDFTGSAGKITIDAGSLSMQGGASISTSSASFGNAGDIVIRVGELTILGARLGETSSISSAAPILLVPNVDLTELIETPGPGRAGTISIDAGRLLTVDGGLITTATEGFGEAGAIAIRADKVALTNGGAIRSDASAFAPANSGRVSIDTGALSVASGGFIATSSANVRPAGDIAVTTGTIDLAGADSRIASANLAPGGGDAGSIVLQAHDLTVRDGASLTTNSVAGAAGRIDLVFPAGGFLTVSGASPGIITTSSGPGTGGRITITRPYAIIADGARIEALGQQRGANVQIATDFFIRSADRANLLLVDGDLVVDSQVGSVSSGLDLPDISFGDAAGVLAGQCSGARTSGSVSQLAVIRIGPMALPGGSAAGCR